MSESGKKRIRTRVEFYPNAVTLKNLKIEAAKKSVTVGQLVNDFIEVRYGQKPESETITELTQKVFDEVEEFIKVSLEEQARLEEEARLEKEAKLKEQAESGEQESSEEAEDEQEEQKPKRIHFTLSKASPTYASIPMSDNDDPSPMRANIGRNFALKIGMPPFENVVKRKTKSGRQSVNSNRALIYEILREDEVE